MIMILMIDEDDASDCGDEEDDYIIAATAMTQRMVILSWR